MGVGTVLSQRPLSGAAASRRRLVGLGCLLAAAAMLLAGCQPAAPVSMRRLIAHAAMLDFSGLQPLAPQRDVRVLASLPLGWEPRPAEVSPLYVHREWRSPSQSNAVGVLYLHLPIPVSARFLVWFMKKEYASARAKHDLPPARLIAQWSDGLGREWVDGENTHYHVRGYVFTSGFEAWIVYSGYRLKSPLNPMEIGMGSRSIEAMVPMTGK